MFTQKCLEKKFFIMSRYKQKKVKNSTFKFKHPTTTSCLYGPGKLNITSLERNSGIKENTYSHSLNWTSLVVHPKCISNIYRNVNGHQYKLDKGPWLRRTHLDDFLDEFGSYWTIYDHIGPLCLLHKYVIYLSITPYN